MPTAALKHASKTRKTKPLPPLRLARPGALAAALPRKTWSMDEAAQITKVTKYVIRKEIERGRLAAFGSATGAFASLTRRSCNTCASGRRKAWYDRRLARRAGRQRGAH